MASQSDVVAQMVAALNASEPDLDTSVGSVTRKILDAVAGQIAAATVDTQMLSYQYDINSMTGAALDSFVQLFGMSRYPAARATGFVTFTRGTAADVVTIPVASQVSTPDGSVVVQTLTAGILEPASLSVSVPVQAVVSGPSGNVPAGSLTQIMTPVSEITAVTNVSSLTGGANQETDTQLQARFEATVFKNMAGTSQMFLGIALNDQDCTAANVIDGATRYREQLQVTPAYTAISTVPDAQYVYPSGQVVGKDIDNGDIAAPGIQYTWDTSVPPVVEVIDHSYFSSGGLIDVSFLYMDKASRNSPSQGIYNRVDVWCAGKRPAAAAATVKFSPSTTFQSSTASNWYAGNFVRPDGSAPAAGNIFLALPYGPILTVPSTMVINGVTYGLASLTNPIGTTSGGVSYAYQIVHRGGAYGWSAYSDFGLEWVASMAPATGTPVVISEDYTYNDVILAIQNNLENWRLAGTDVQAHQGVEVPLQFSLAAIFETSATPSAVQAAINTSLSGYLATLGFGSVLYPSSVINIVENTPGVVACRFITAIDVGTSWTPGDPDSVNVGIQAVYDGVVTESYVDSEGNPLTVEFGADELPVFASTFLITKAANTFGSFT